MVASASLTTVVGLLMLLFMSFRIGADLGVVLAKGVAIGQVCKDLAVTETRITAGVASTAA